MHYKNQRMNQANKMTQQYLSRLYERVEDKRITPVRSYLNGLYNKFNDDTPQHAPAKIPKLGPSMSTSSDSQTQRIEESEPKS